MLRLLDVELVVDYNTGAQPFWGKTGHYSLATFACDQLTAPKLSKLILANRDRISFAIAELSPAGIDQATKDAKKNGTASSPSPTSRTSSGRTSRRKSRRPGHLLRDRTGTPHPLRRHRRTPPRRENPPRSSAWPTPTNVTVPVWQAFYTGLGHTKSADRGLLPFRVWQFFDAMVDALHRKDATGYVCAAGLMAHYVGDACQPLHGSVLADGFPDGRGKGVHSAYETSMIDHHATEIVAGLQTALPAPAEAGPGQHRPAGRRRRGAD